MTSLAVPITVRAARSELVYTAETWTEMVALCLPAVDGEQRLAFANGRGVRVLEGLPLRYTLGPNTEVHVQTTSSGAVEWSFLFTPLSFLPRGLSGDGPGQQRV